MYSKEGMNGNVIVGVRVRPPLEREIEGEKQFNNCVAVDGHQGIVFIKPSHKNLSLVSI